jgi:spermidine synthase
MKRMAREPRELDMKRETTSLGWQVRRGAVWLACVSCAVWATSCASRPEEPGDLRPTSVRSAAPSASVLQSASPWATVSAAPILGPSVETTVFETRSAFSHFLVRDKRTTRSLYFVRDSGEIVLESALDRETPHNLLVEYTRIMFVSHLFVPEQKSALVVGLGGGSMVHFLRHFAPSQRVDVVEIDPAIVKAADDYFGVRSGGNVRIYTEDAFKHLATSTETYDVIYMDAFLKPSGDTDQTGVPLRMKTAKFLKDLQKNISPGGLVVFNLNEHESLEQDIDTIRSSFARVYRFPAKHAGNYIVVGHTVKKPLTRDELVATAKTLDERKLATFSFRELAELLDTSAK